MFSLIFINMQISCWNESYQKRKAKALTLIWHQFEASSIKNKRIIKEFVLRGNRPTVVMVTISKLKLTKKRSLYFTRLFFGDRTDIQLSNSNKIISVLFSPRLSLFWLLLIGLIPNTYHLSSAKQTHRKIDRQTERWTDRQKGQTLYVEAWKAT